MRSRAEITSIVKSYLQEKQESRIISRLVTGAELMQQGIRQPNIYGLRYALEDCWIAYLVSDTPYSIRASDVVIVRDETGEVVYHGSAHDEG